MPKSPRGHPTQLPESPKLDLSIWRSDGSEPLTKDQPPHPASNRESRHMSAILTKVQILVLPEVFQMSLSISPNPLVQGFSYSCGAVTE